MSSWSRLSLVAAAVAGAFGVALGSAASGPTGDVSTLAGVRLRATLDVKDVVPAPRNLRPATAGAFIATLTGDRLRWRLTFRRLTSLAYGAHVHFGPPGTREVRFGEELMRNQQAIFLCGPCVSGSHGLEPPLALWVTTRILQGDAFIVVHTGLNQYGELAGRLMIVRSS